MFQICALLLNLKRKIHLSTLLNENIKIIQIPLTLVLFKFFYAKFLQKIFFFALVYTTDSVHSTLYIFHQYSNFITQKYSDSIRRFKKLIYTSPELKTALCIKKQKNNFHKHWFKMKFNSYFEMMNLTTNKIKNKKSNFSKMRFSLCTKIIFHTLSFFFLFPDIVEIVFNT